MAFDVQTKINTYDVSAYRVVEAVVFNKKSGCEGKAVLSVHTNDLPSKELTDQQGVRFNPLEVTLMAVKTRAMAKQDQQPDGSIVVTPQPDLPAYGDLVGAPLSTWFQVPAGVETAEQLLSQVSLHDLVFKLAYQVARLNPQTRDATDA